MSWSDKYIGIPYLEGGRDFSGCDCGGLVLLALRLEQEIIATDFTEYEKTDFYNGSGLMKLSHGIQRCLDKEWLPVTDPKPFDLVRFRVGKAFCHVGLYVAGGMFLHVEEAAGDLAHLAPMTAVPWGKRFVEFRRHEHMMKRTL